MYTCRERGRQVQRVERVDVLALVKTENVTYQETRRVVQEAAKATHKAPLQEGRVLRGQLFRVVADHGWATVKLHLYKNHKENCGQSHASMCRCVMQWFLRSEWDMDFQPGPLGKEIFKMTVGTLDDEILKVLATLYWRTSAHLLRNSTSLSYNLFIQQVHLNLPPALLFPASTFWDTLNST